MEFTFFFENQFNQKGQIFIFENALIIEFIAEENTNEAKLKTALRRDLFFGEFFCKLPEKVQVRLISEEEYDENNLFKNIPFILNPNHYYFLMKFKQIINAELFSAIFIEKILPTIEFRFPTLMSRNDYADLFDYANTFFQTEIKVQQEIAKTAPIKTLNETTIELGDKSEVKLAESQFESIDNENEQEEDEFIRTSLQKIEEKLAKIKRAEVCLKEIRENLERSIETASNFSLNDAALLKEMKEFYDKHGDQELNGLTRLQNRLQTFQPKANNSNAKVLSPVDDTLEINDNISSSDEKSKVNILLERNLDPNNKQPILFLVNTVDTLAYSALSQTSTLAKTDTTSTAEPPVTTSLASVVTNSIFAVGSAIVSYLPTRTTPEIKTEPTRSKDIRNILP